MWKIRNGNKIIYKEEYVFEGKVVNQAMAVSLNRVIGNLGSIPWQGLVPSDMQRFKKMTANQSVVYGRKTWDSLPPKFRPLPDRQNIVVTRNNNWSPKVDDVLVAYSIEEAIIKASSEVVWIIGGAEIYLQSLEYADALHITHIEGYFVGDTFFPFQIDTNLWHIGYVENLTSPPDKIFSSYKIYTRR